MEFEDLQKIWGAQNEPLYAINEKAMHQLVLSKKSKAHRITHLSELMLIAVNIGSGTMSVILPGTQPNVSIFLYVLAAWMYVTAGYVLVSRLRRLKAERQFDRTLLGDLKHALSVATYQVRLAYIMRWNGAILGTLILLSVWDSGKPLWTIVLLCAILALAYFAGHWEQRYYQARKRELEVLLQKLEV